MFWHGQTVTVRRYATDRYGDRTVVASFAVAHCAFAPRATRAYTEEDYDRSERVESGAELYVPPQAGIESSDVVTLADGTDWEVAGRTDEWASPFTSWQPGALVRLTRMTG